MSDSVGERCRVNLVVRFGICIQSSLALIQAGSGTTFLTFYPRPPRAFTMLTMPQANLTFGLGLALDRSRF